MRSHNYTVDFSFLFSYIPEIAGRKGKGWLREVANCVVLSMIKGGHDKSWLKHDSLGYRVRPAWHDKTRGSSSSAQ